jgi:hypothetical protein
MSLEDNASCPGRGLAFFTMHRRAGIQSFNKMDPGSAAHHHSASKTRVDALTVLRSIRGTQPYRPGRSSRLSSPAATLRPSWPCTLSG